MKKFSILAFITALFFSGCSKKSSMDIDENSRLVLKTSTSKEFVLATVVEDIDTLHVESVTVEQKAMKSSSEELLFYEKIEIDSDSIFNQSSKESIRYIFNAKELEILYMYKDIMVLQLRLKDKIYINILAESSNETVLHVVYGFSNTECKKMIKLIDSDVNEGSESLTYEAKSFTKNRDIKSDWSDKKLLLEPFTMIVTE